MDGVCGSPPGACTLATEAECGAHRRCSAVGYCEPALSQDENLDVECSEDGDCGIGGRCRFGICTSCLSDSDCPSPKVCGSSGRCEQPFLCARASDCFAGNVCAARERPDVPILCLTENRQTARRLSIAWGVHAAVTEDIKNFQDMVERAVTVARREEIADVGDRLVITAGVPFGTPGATNILRIAWIGD
mgnify:CR=1 FL=1